MKKIILLSLIVLFVSCNNSDDLIDDISSNIIGKWETILDEPIVTYEMYVTYEFKSNDVCVEYYAPYVDGSIDYDKMRMNNHTYKINEEENILILDGLVHFKIEKLTKNELVINNYASLWYFKRAK
jgi:hypothetical protein